MKTVAIIGRPNVGKSRLFNRLIRKRIAIVDDHPGITRDRIEEIVEERGELIRWIDTGGIGLDDEFGKAITLQAEVAISISDIAILVVDAKTGILPLDMEIANKLRGKVPVIIAVNKIDEPSQENLTADFIKLGFSNIIPISAEHGRRIEELVDIVISKLGTEDSIEEFSIATRVAIIGKPNVGKSSLLNAILGEERVIVSEIPGTTRDAIEAKIDLPRGTIVLTDTAGIRKKRRQYTKLESIMVGRTKRAVEQSEVAIVVVDASLGLTDQDIRIADGVMKLGKAVIFALNKWDLVEDKVYDKIVKSMRYKLGKEAHIPIISISAIKKIRINKLLELALLVGQNAAKRIKTSELNRILLDTAQRAPKGIRIKYGIQRSIAPPSFLIFGTSKIPKNIEQFLISSIRKIGGYNGIPIVLEFRR